MQVPLFEIEVLRLTGVNRCILDHDGANVLERSRRACRLAAPAN
jgi:hypothetical protein